MLSVISKKDRKKIVTLRKTGMTLVEVGEVYGVTRERIRQILKEIGDFQKYNYPNHTKHKKGYGRCYRCKRELRTSKFYKDRSSSRGHAQICIECTKAVQLEHLKKNREYNKGGKYWEKQKARIAVSAALRSGKLRKERCIFWKYGCKGKIQAHHYLGYRKKNYLDVLWLCRKHHRMVDNSAPFGKK